MGVNSLPKTFTRQRRGCDLNPGPTAPESSTLTTRLPSQSLTVPCRRRGMPAQDTGATRHVDFQAVAHPVARANAMSFCRRRRRVLRNYCLPCHLRRLKPSHLLPADR